MVRRSKGKTEEVLARIHDMRVQGYTHEQIQRELDIKPATYYRVYIPKLTIHWQNAWESKTREEVYHIAELANKRLHDCYQNAREKAREDKAAPQWGQLEEELLFLLNKFENEGLAAVLDGRFRQIEQKIRAALPNQRPLILKEQRRESKSISESSQPAAESESNRQQERYDDSQRRF